MRNRWIITGLLGAAGLLTAARPAAAQPTAWDVSGNDCPPVWAPIGTYQHDGSGWYTGLEYSDLPQPVQSDDGFQWGGVQIGAGAALAALLLATMTTIGLRTKGGRPATS